MTFKTAGEKELKRDWPHESGLEANQKHEGRRPHLKPRVSLVPAKEKVLL